MEGDLEGSALLGLYIAQPAKQPPLRAAVTHRFTKICPCRTQIHENYFYSVLGLPTCCYLSSIELDADIDARDHWLVVPTFVYYEANMPVYTFHTP